MKLYPRVTIVVLATALLHPSTAAGHEAWLLTPSEVAALSRAPMPALFTNPAVLGLAAVLGGIGAWIALRAEDRLRPIETRLAAPVAALSGAIGPVLLRIGLALMLGLAALGGLPRAGTAPWAEPVLFVPDMQLALAPGWGWLASVQLILAGLLALGLATRAAAVGVMVLAGLGVAAFGTKFLAYAPHFVAPGLALAVFGPGWLALDRLLPVRAPAIPPVWRNVAWHTVMALVGLTFVYLGIAFKLFQPTLLIAILQHGNFPTLGLPLPLIALAMTGVEIVAGLVLALGRLVRPVALFLMGAFTFFAVMLGETPLFHANLYGMAALLLMAGAAGPRPAPAFALGQLKTV